MKQPGSGYPAESASALFASHEQVRASILRSAGVPNLLSNQAQLFFTETEYALARDAATFASTQNLRQFFQRESKLESPLRELDRLDCSGIEYPVAALGSA